MNIVEEAKKIIEQGLEEVKKRNNEETRNEIISGIREDLINIFAPFSDKIASNSKLSKEEIIDIIRQIKIEPVINYTPPKLEIPKIEVPPVEFPRDEMMSAIREAFKGIVIQPPVLNLKPPDVKMPGQMEVKGIVGYFQNLINALSGRLNVGLDEIDRDKPLHVVLVDKDGQYYLPGRGTMLFGGGGGTKFSVEEIDLSSQCNGVENEFDLGKTVSSVILVNLNGSLMSYTLNVAKDKITLAISPDTGESLKAVVAI